jgi:hypothetical protein
MKQLLYILTTFFYLLIYSCGGSADHNTEASDQESYVDNSSKESPRDDLSGDNDEKVYQQQQEQNEYETAKSTPDNVKSNKSVDLLDLIPGKLAFDIPKKMKVGERYDVTFSITQSLNENILFKGLDSTKFEIRNIDVSSGMRVLIYDPEKGRNFEIHSQSANIQHVTSNKNTTWLWHIKPLKKGSHKIIAKVHATIYTERGTEREINQIVFNEEINVEATPVFTLSNFFNSNWQWLFGTLLIPLFVYFYRKRKKSETA